jgi:uncharacterized protein (TIGR02271 family)
MAKTIVGLFDSRDTARTVADDLEASGFRRSDIDISQAGAAAEHEPERKREGGFWNWFLGADDLVQERYTYDEGFRRGHAAVAVTVDDASVDEAEAIMNRHHPLDLHTESRQWRQEGWSAGGESIPVVEENVDIGKRAVQKGGIRIYSRVVERPVEEEVSLRDEKVSVERRPVNRPATDPAFQDRVIEARETEEEPVVSKTARVVEEVSLSKEEREHRAKVEDTERHTEVDVEHLKRGSDEPRTRR